MAEPKQPTGRMGRRARREEAGAVARELLNSSSADRLGSERKTKLLTLIGLAAGFGSWGYFVLAPDPNVYFGCTLIVLCYFFLAFAFWNFIGWKLKYRIAILLLAFAIAFATSYYWVRYITRPSFVFMVPGVVLNGNSWDFLINHRGPKTSESVQILFVDQDKQSEVLRSHSSLSGADLDSYQRLITYPQINPMGRGQIFAQQFIWTPPVFDHEHYTIEITAKDRSIHQDIQIERVQGKWLWATQVKDRETGKQLLNCKDDGFPYGDQAPVRCFPEMTEPGV